MTTPRSSSHGVPYVVIGVAALSALAVFFSLWERDESLLVSARNHIVSQPTAPQHAPLVSAESQPAADSITRVTVPTAEAAASTQPADSVAAAGSAPTEAAVAHGIRRYLDFTLTRSKRFQQVGPVLVGVWKIDAKHKLYDVSVMANGHRVDRKHVGLNSPVSIVSAEAGRPLQLVVSSITRGSISGHVSEPQAAH